MGNSDNTNLDDKEIDLAAISRLVSGMFASISRSVFRLIRFVSKRIVIFIALFIIGAGLGFYLDSTNKTYDTCIIVRPNFESTDYVYSKIDLIFSKIVNQDTMFLKSIGIKHPKLLKSIKIYPIIDVYKFIEDNNTNEKDQNFQLLKLLAEDGDLKTIINDEATSKNYAFHQIHFVTSAAVSRKEILEPLLNYLDDSEFYRNSQKIYLENTKFRIEANKNMIAQIDGLLSTFISENGESAKSNKSVYVSENTQLNDLLKTKKDLVADIGFYENELLSRGKVVKENSSIINMKNTKALNTKLKIILPFVFIFMYLFIFGFIRFYKKQAFLYSKEKL